MKNNFNFLVLLILLSGPFSAMASSTTLSDPEGVPAVELQKYAGLWHEIAKTPNFFQRKCKKSTAEYQVLSPTSLSVLNTCFHADEKVTDIHGVAKIVNPEVPAKLKVKFKVFLINPSGDYWITELDPEYQWAVVSGPGKKYNFILARKFPMKEETKKQIFATLKTKGYPVSEFIFDEAK